MTDTISVVMPVRDGAAYLDAAIRSIRGQTLEVFEFLIIDDGSTDGSQWIIAGHAAQDPRIRVVTQARLGVAEALNRGLAEASGALVARMDADDIALPDRLVRQRRALAEHPNVVVLGSRCEMIDQVGASLGVMGGPETPDAIRAGLREANVIAHPTVMLRRDIVLAAGGYRKAFDGCEDYDLWLRLSEQHDLMNLQEVLLRYRYHPMQVTARHAAEQRLAALVARHAAGLRRAGQADPSIGADRIDRSVLRRGGLDDTAVAQVLVGAAPPPVLSAPHPLTMKARRIVRPLARAALRRLSHRDAIGPGDAWAHRAMLRTDWGRDRIFVIIPSYRDPECQWTVRDLFAKAQYPDRVTVGIAWQLDSSEDAHCLVHETRPAQVRSLIFPPQKSFGCSWARHQCLRLWHGEEYALQIDSHMRFVDAWDVKMLEQLDQCASPRPLLTTRPLHYDPPDVLGEPYHATITAGDFDESGILHVGGALWPLADAPPRPTPTAFVAGGFIFGPARRLVEVPYDPYIYFFGEELNLSVRLWTAGWDLFVPSETLTYHYYAPNNRRTPWKDDIKSYKLNAPTMARLLHLLGMEPARDRRAITDIHRYGLGSARSIAAFERFAGVDFRARSVSDRARQGIFG